VIEPHMTGAAPGDFGSLLAQAGSGLASLDTREETGLATTGTMLEAHENLVRLSPGNLPKFKDVLAFLREDLKRLGADKQETR
jgi:hypothetical protein